MYYVLCTTGFSTIQTVVDLGISEDFDAAKVLLLALGANLASNAMGFLK